MRWMNLSNSGAAQYPSDGKGGQTATAASSLYYPGAQSVRTIALGASNPGDGETVTVPAMTLLGVTYSAVTFEFDNNAATTAGNVRVAIGASIAASVANLSAVMLGYLPQWTITHNGVDTVTLTAPSVGTAFNVTLTKSGANITVASPTAGAEAASHGSKRVRLIRFQPRNTGAAAGGTVAIDSHSGSSAQITLPASTTASVETLSFIPLDITLSGLGLKVTPSAAAVQGTLFFEDV